MLFHQDQLHTLWLMYYLIVAVDVLDSSRTYPAVPQLFGAPFISTLGRIYITVTANEGSSKQSIVCRD